jgi:hypothetical protein
MAGGGLKAEITGWIAQRAPGLSQACWRHTEGQGGFSGQTPGPGLFWIPLKTLYTQ